MDQIIQAIPTVLFAVATYFAGHYKLLGGALTPATPATPATGTPATPAASTSAQQIEQIVANVVAALQGSPAAPATPAAAPTAKAATPATPAAATATATTASSNLPPSQLVSLINQYRGNQNFAQAEADAVKTFLADVAPSPVVLSSSVATGS